MKDKKEYRDMIKSVISDFNFSKMVTVLNTLGITGYTQESLRQKSEQIFGICYQSVLQSGHGDFVCSNYLRCYIQVIGEQITMCGLLFCLQGVDNF